MSSSRNGAGIWKWDADAVAGNTIVLSITSHRNATVDDHNLTLTTYYTTWQYSYTFSASHTFNRDNPFAGGDFFIQTGLQSVGETSGTLPPFFRLTIADPSISLLFSGTLTATTDVTYEAAEDYEGEVPPNEHYTTDVTVVCGASFSKDDLTHAHWNAGYGDDAGTGYPYQDSPVGTLDVPFVVDAFTLKKAGSTNFGFTYSHTTDVTDQYSGLNVVSQDVSLSLSAAVT